MIQQPSNFTIPLYFLWWDIWASFWMWGMAFWQILGFLLTMMAEFVLRSRPLLSIEPFHDWTYVHCFSLLAIFSKEGLFIMCQKFESFEHLFLEKHFFGSLACDFVLLLEPFLQGKVFFLVSMAHIYSIFSLFYCRYSLTDSSLKRENNTFAP